MSLRGSRCQSKLVDPRLTPTSVAVGEMCLYFFSITGYCVRKKSHEVRLIRGQLRLGPGSHLASVIPSCLG